MDDFKSTFTQEEQKTLAAFGIDPKLWDDIQRFYKKAAKSRDPLVALAKELLGKIVGASAAINAQLSDLIRERGENENE